MDELLTAAEACAHLKIKSAVTLRRWRKAGKLPVVKLSDGTVRYRRSDLDGLALASVTWEAAPETSPKPITAAPSWLDRDAINPITGVRYGRATDGAR